METLKKKYRIFLNKDNLKSLGFSIALLIVSLVWEKIADNYVLKLKGVVVDDLFLSYLPPVDVTYIIVQGALLLTFLVVILFIFEPKYINFGLKAVALFILTRSFFISLTHLGAYPNQLVFDTETFGFRMYNVLFNTSNDFFFSGHTGLPFMMSLIFWPHKRWRYIFMIISIVFGVSVLFAHIHYSIDVFAAPFITYSVFALARALFPHDYNLSREKREVKLS